MQLGKSRCLYHLTLKLYQVGKCCPIRVVGPQLEMFWAKVDSDESDQGRINYVPSFADRCMKKKRQPRLKKA
jgi:hypothetical protein